MTKTIVARKGKARTKTRKPTLDEIRGSLTRTQSALLTAILACENSGVHGYVATSLRAHVFFPLRDLQEAIEGKEVRS